MRCASYHWRTAKSEKRLLQLQQVHTIDIQRLARAEYGDDDGQTHRSFGRGHHHYKEHENLPIQRPQLRGERHKRQVHTIQHQLNGKKNRDDIALDEKPGNAARKQNRAQHQVIGQRNHLFLPPRQHNRAHDGDQDQHRSNLERQEVIAEEQPPDRLRIAEHVAAIHYRRPTNPDAIEPGVVRDDAGSDPQSDDQRRYSERCSNPAGMRQSLFFAGIQQHDDEDEQHHDGTGVDDYLHRGDEFGAQEQINDRQRTHHHDQRQRAVDGVLLHQQVNGARHAQNRENKKENKT